MKLRCSWPALLFFFPLAAPALCEDAPTAPPAHPPMIVVDPGHGGKDLGAVIHSKVEKDIAFSFARRLQDQIDRIRGLTASLTRSGDAFVPLADRVDRAREAGGRAFISIHVDDARRARDRGVAVYYYGRFRRIHPRPGERVLPDPPGSQIAASRRLAEKIRQSLQEQGIQAHALDRGAFVVLKSPDIPSVLVEIGNLRDPRESARIADPVYEENLTRAIARGVERYLAHAPVLSAKR